MLILKTIYVPKRVREAIWCWSSVSLLKKLSVWHICLFLPYWVHERYNQFLWQRWCFSPLLMLSLTLLSHFASTKNLCSASLRWFALIYILNFSWSYWLFFPRHENMLISPLLKKTPSLLITFIPQPLQIWHWCWPPVSTERASPIAYYYYCPCLKKCKLSSLYIWF